MIPRADDPRSGVPPWIATMMEGRRTADRQSNEPLQGDVHDGAVRPTNQPGSTPGGQSSEIPSRRSPQRVYVPNQPRSSSPERLFDCDGWCRYTRAADSSPSQTVVSIRVLIQEGSCLMFVFRSLYLPARPFSAHGKAQKAR